MKPSESARKPALDADEAAHRIGLRAEHLFATKQLWCAAAVLVTHSLGMGGGMPEEMAIRITSGLGEGLSGAGCTCGALSGGVLAVGLFLGSGRMTPTGSKPSMNAARELHDRFRREFGATCCRVLIKSVRLGSSAHYAKCARHTAWCAQQAAELILRHRPEQLRHVDWDYLNMRENRFAARLKTAVTRFMV